MLLINVEIPPETYNPEKLAIPRVSIDAYPLFKVLGPNSAPPSNQEGPSTSNTLNTLVFKPLKVVAVRIPAVAIPEMLTLSKFV